MTAAGRSWADAVAAKDHDAVRALLVPDVDFRALTPGRPWEATTSDEVLEILFGHWFEDQDHVVGLLAVDTGDPVEDVERVGYRLAMRNPDGDFTVEQQAYFRTTDGRITHLRVLCSGFQPSAPRAASVGGGVDPVEWALHSDIL
jgi:ketosteroid isomerase-like protein